MIIILLTSNLSCSEVEVGKIYKPKDEVKWLTNDGTDKMYGGINYYRNYTKENTQQKNDTLFVGIISRHYCDARDLYTGIPYTPIPVFPAFLFSFWRSNNFPFACGVLLRSRSNLPVIDKNKLKVVINKSQDLTLQVDLQKKNFYRVKNYDENTGIWHDSLGYNNIYFLIESNILAKKVKNFSIDFNDSIMDSSINFKKVIKFYYTPVFMN